MKRIGKKRPAWLLALIVGLILGVSARLDAQADSGDDSAPIQEPDSPPVGPLSDESDELEEPEASELDEPLPVERITFSLPFTSESGGGTATGSAGTLDYVEENVVVVSDAVEVNYQDLRLQADTVTVNLETKMFSGQGHVILDEGPRRVTAERLEFDLETKVGTFYEAKAFVDPDVYFEGREIHKVTDDKYTVIDGMISSCSEDKVPDWSFRLGKARVKIDGFARVRNTRMKLKKLPILYLPYMLFPTTGGRTAGFLFPNFGYSEQRGENLGLAYFQPFGDSYDATFFADLYGEDFLGLGTEFRYQPSHATGGALRFSTIEDSSGEFLDVPVEPGEPIPTESRWKANWTHASNELPFGLRGLINYRDFSDFDFFRDFERNFNDISIRSLYSQGFLSGNWGSHSLNVLIDNRETFIRRDTFVTQRQLPEIEYRLRPTQIGGLPIYFSLLSSMNLFEVGRTNLLDENYSRADVSPSLTIPVSTIPWLSASVGLSARTTFYENSLNDVRTAFTGESLTRTFPSGSASIIGPSFSKIFDKKRGNFSKFKHVIEPRWSYLFVDEFEDQELVPLFDEVDTLQDRTIIGVALVNRLLAKPGGADSEESAREILTFELGQSFSLRDEQPFEQSSDLLETTKKSPISMRLRFNPSERTSFELRSSYSDLFSDFQSASLLGSKRFSRGAIGLSWVAQFNPELDVTRSHQARFFTDFAIVRNHFRMQNQINYDFVTGFMQQQRHVFYYTAQCYGLRFEFRELKNPILNGTDFREDRDFRIAISLKNIGTFLDLGHGLGPGF